MPLKQVDDYFLSNGIYEVYILKLIVFNFTGV